METKKRRKTLWLVLPALSLILFYALLGNAGSLEPSGVPGPTMKTLDEVEPRTAIHASDLPMTITTPNSYYLAEDINFTSDTNHAITIECDNVTIDLMGYTLKGPDSGSKSGFYMYGCNNVEIRNGVVRDFGYFAIYEGSTSSGKGHRVINMRLVSNNLSGVILNGSGHLVKDCTAAENGNNGIYTGNNCIITGNTCYNSNNNHGIYSGIGSTVTDNTCYNNNYNGISAGAGSIVSGNNCYNNGDDGISAGIGSTVSGNSCYDNGDRGITVTSGCTIAGNTARDNTGYGIYTENFCLVDQNTAFNNTGGNLTTGGGTVLGTNCAP